MRQKTKDNFWNKSSSLRESGVQTWTVKLGAVQGDFCPTHTHGGCPDQDSWCQVFLRNTSIRCGLCSVRCELDSGSQRALALCSF
mmetsp:Transcript_37077/g.98779  ORF Transcript_37077/g.98779 Transcript_37077/m.98779 type:complete len:85 (-) Transcript_37077:64-318(-)